MTEISAIIARCRGRIEHSKAKLASIEGGLLNMTDISPLLQRIDEGNDELDKMMKDDVTPEQEEKIKQTLSVVEKALDSLDLAIEMFTMMRAFFNSLVQSDILNSLVQSDQ